MIASGAYESNVDMAAAYEGLPGWLSMYPSTITGEGIVMAMEIGAGSRTIHNSLGLFLGFNVPADDPGGEPSFRLASIAEVRRQYDTTDLREKLARRHVDPDAAFRGWNDIWLAPAFRSWNIEASLSGVRCPLLLIQGRDDEYGSTAQLDAIERQVGGKVTRIELADCRHSPHRDRPDATLAAIADFVATMAP